jgi:hypothetical protein
LLIMTERLPMGKVKSSRLSLAFFIFIRCLFHCEGQRKENNVHVASQKSIQLGIPATSRTHKYCIICKKAATNRNHMITVPERRR